MQEIAPDVEQYLDRVVSALRDDLGPHLIGVYMHGSLAMGAFTPGRSDIDVLAVCAAPLPPERSTPLGEVLDALPRPTSGGDLEFILIAEAAVRAASAAPAFELHVSTHEEPSVVDGHDRPGDEALVIHFAMARTRGRSLFGPDPVEMFPEPDRALLIPAMRGDIEWARSSGAAGREGHLIHERGVDGRGFGLISTPLSTRGRRFREIEGTGLRSAPGTPLRTRCAHP